MSPAVDSTLDVVFWFIDRGMADREYLQPQKLHRLLYLAQAYFAIANYGRKLMPAGRCSASRRARQRSTCR